MLNERAFANSLAVLTAALSVLFALIALVSPRAFAQPRHPSGETNRREGR
jgi:hypothetical protein